MKIVLIGSLLFLFSCQQEEVNDTKRFEGFDINGLERTCNPPRENEMCTAVFTEAEAFAEDCREAGFEAIQCGCHDYMCSGPLGKSGRDINGETRTCAPASDDLICTTEFTPNDQFAQDCRDAGLEVVTCGCHDYICVE